VAAAAQSFLPHSISGAHDTVPGMLTRPALRRVTATRYVTPLREGGSLPGLVEADDCGMYVAKFRAAGQGVKALTAEIVVGELARLLGLPVPEQVALHIDRELGLAEPDPEIQDLITGSDGVNLGVDFLPGALAYTPAFEVHPVLAADVVWLDALTMNVDRTARNPNLLVWHQRLWLIDHGAALYLQHAGLRPAEHFARAFPQIAEHVLLGVAGSIVDAQDRLASRVDAATLAAVLALVPSEWAGRGERDAFVEFLARRCADGGFAEEAERARTAA
jgi:hypothetical protein